ncbi:hypothetical protein JOF53_008204 [Crossiella equi]|uniref:Uncharacterized protein n=1 Tax=Crossiella equi TaxID=130796 RepID=A0ABS5ARX2_9PSEU|nr:hypothetical protein [Crossiella equi]MBP2479332.1 hypothetical protein [Crossiella equi]
MPTSLLGPGVLAHLLLLPAGVAAGLAGFGLAAHLWWQGVLS